MEKIEKKLFHESLSYKVICYFNKMPTLHIELSSYPISSDLTPPKLLHHLTLSIESEILGKNFSSGRLDERIDMLKMIGVCLEAEYSTKKISFTAKKIIPSRLYSVFELSK